MTERGNDLPFPGKADDGGPTAGIGSEALIHKAFEEDFNAGVELLFRWYYAPLCNHAIRFVASREQAEEIVSEVFSAFYLQKPFYKKQSSMRAWLFTCVRNKALNYVRSEMRKHFSLDYAERELSPDQQPDEMTEFEDLYHTVQNAVNTLPLRRRSIFIMNKIEGKKLEEIARELDISVKTVKEHMYQALQRIRKEIREKWPMAWPVLLLNNMEQLWNLL